MKKTLMLLTAGFFASLSLNTTTVQAQNNFQAPVVNGTVNIPTSFGSLRSIDFIDYDGDGDQDITAVLEFPTFNGNLAYIENTGSSTIPAYNPLTATFLASNIDYTANTSDLTSMYHTMTDFDADGDIDGFILTTTRTNLFAEQLNTPRFIENNAGTFTASSSTVSPFVALQGITHDGTVELETTSCTFADLDGDGDQDFFKMTSEGRLLYIPDTSTSGTPAFGAQVDQTSLASSWNFNLISSSQGSSYAAIAITDMDGDTDLDIIIQLQYYNTTTMQNEPRFFYYENDGSTTSPAFLTGVVDPFGLDTYASSVAGSLLNMDFVDVDGDGDLDLFGLASGNDILFFENTGANATSSDSIEFASSTLSIAEDGGNATVTVNLSDPVLLGASVDVALVGGTATEGTDFTYSATETATFPINDNTAQTITIAITDDTDVEGDETIILALTNVSGSTIGTVDTLTITITDNDVQTSVNDINNETEIQVYPNPFDQQLVIETASNEVAYLRIMDQLGRVLIEQTVNQKTTVINTEKLARGIYTVHIKNEKTGTVQQSQFVKQ